MSQESKIAMPNQLSDESCLVCGRLSSKLHLQVQICYGCAAFYRRAINTKKNYRCRNMKNECELANQTRPLCRLCRFKRCKELDLQINKGYPKIVNAFELEYKAADETDPWNIPDLLYQINSIFKKNSNPSATNYGISFDESFLNLIQATESPNKEYILCESEHLSTSYKIFLRNKFVLNSAKLLSVCPSFQKLPINEKILIHDRFWQILLTLRDYHISCEKFGRGPEFKYIVDNVQYIDITNTQKCLKMEESKVFGPILKIKGAQLFTEFKKLNATFFEFNYICLILIWSFHSLPQLNETTKKLGDKIIEDASKKLHHYYVNELRLQGYAARQARLFKIAHSTEQLIQCESEVIQAWKLFNVDQNDACKFKTKYFIQK